MNESISVVFAEGYGCMGLFRVCGVRRRLWRKPGADGSASADDYGRFVALQCFSMNVKVYTVSSNRNFTNAEKWCMIQIESIVHNADKCHC